MSAGRLTLLQPGRLTARSWAPYGWIPLPDTDPADGEQTLHFSWSDPHLNVIAHARDEVAWLPEGAVVHRLFRHETHTQALMAIDRPGIIAVAPPGTTFVTAADLDSIEAFRIETLAPIVLHRGTWHWGPFPLGEEPIRLLNVQGRRYAEDNDSTDVAALGPVVVAAPGGS